MFYIVLIAAISLIALFLLFRFITKKPPPRSPPEKVPDPQPDLEYQKYQESLKRKPPIQETTPRRVGESMHRVKPHGKDEDGKPL